MAKHIHILGICGTFMGGLAQIAVEAGFKVTGSDQNVYPPMSDQLNALGVEIYEGYDAACLSPRPDAVIVGNVMSRGNPVVEAMLDQGIPYYSGPQWLFEEVLQSREVIAIAGTHGKTTTTTLLVWLLQQAGIDCGYLIGGVAKGLESSAKLGSSKYFVIESDEYDSAFFDKRSKFLHYRPTHLLFNNLEFDHADIFANLDAIKWQFEQLLRMIPPSGTVIYPAEDDNVMDVLARGCWSQKVSWGQGDGDGDVRWQRQAGSQTAFALQMNDGEYVFDWSMLGEHNVKNATAAIIAARKLGLTIEQIKAGLQNFPGIKRRLELIAEIDGVSLYDDFAHHPTAVALGIQAIRNRATPGERVIAVLEFASYTMRSGHHQGQLGSMFEGADAVFLLTPDNMDWDAKSSVSGYAGDVVVADTVEHLLEKLLDSVRSGDHVLIMSNRSFGGIHQKLKQALVA